MVDVFKDKNGFVRSAKIRTDMGTFLTRPVSKLAVLDVRNGLVQQIDVKLNQGSVNGEEDVGNGA